MSMTGDQAQQAGIAFAKAHLEVIEAAYGRDVATCYAQGFACYARDQMLNVIGPRETYNRFAHIADDALNYALPEGK